jgi:phosphatidylserine/phosphatidylglycerophosphate/cardiolipin synthase-like enzyme
VHVYIAPLRFSAEDTFPDGKAMPNHSKLLMVDDQAFYIGSQNLYLADLAEFGFLVDDARAAYQLRHDYYNKLWTWAGRRERPSAGLNGCALPRE